MPATDLLARRGEEQPAAFVLGLGEPVRLGAVDVVVAVHLVGVHLAAQRLLRLLPS